MRSTKEHRNSIITVSRGHEYLDRLGHVQNSTVKSLLHVTDYLNF